MSSESDDSEEEERVKLCMEAADVTLLSNSLFQNTETSSVDKNPTVELKSQRYIVEEANELGIDVVVPETTQRFIAKKLTEILNKQIEFVQMEANKISKKSKSRIKLLSDADCYVKPYEEFEYEFKGPQKKPNIKRREIDKSENTLSEAERLQSAAVEADFILSGQDSKQWNKAPPRAHKLYKYKATKKGTLIFKEPENEFTKARNKNQWHESKIKRLKK